MFRRPHLSGPSCCSVATACCNRRADHHFLFLLLHKDRNWALVCVAFTFDLTLKFSGIRRSVGMIIVALSSDFGLHGQRRRSRHVSRIGLGSLVRRRYSDHDSTIACSVWAPDGGSHLLCRRTDFFAPRRSSSDLSFFLIGGCTHMSRGPEVLLQLAGLQYEL